MTTLNNEQRFNIITRNLEEIIGEDDLRYMLDSGAPINHYIGFEISGKPHIGQALIVMQKVKDLMDAGVNVNFLLADLHTYLNGKLNGDMKLIAEVRDGYFTEIIKASIMMLGGEPEKLNFIKGGEYYAAHPDYWTTFLEISKNTTLARIERSISIMGRTDGESQDFGTLCYPPMQAADIFAMKINIVQGGIDQRKIHVVMRDVAKYIKTNAPEFNGKFLKPVAIHTPLLPALDAPAVWPLPEGCDMKQMQIDMKMSKSKPGGAIYIDDEPEKIKKTIMKGFCAEKEIEYNPILEWVKMIVFDRDGKEITIVRPEQYGGNISFKDYEDLKKKFADGLVHPIDVKNFLADYLINLFAPAREHFAKSPYREMKARTEEILESVKKKR